MANYYDKYKPTSANSKCIMPKENDEQHFPSEGLFFGELTGGKMDIPALIDLAEGQNLCIMYETSDGRESANRCLERLAWRIAITVPANLCDIILFNGGRPGDAFDIVSRVNKYLYDNRDEKLYYDGNLQEFSLLLHRVYKSINERMQEIRSEGKSSLYELNQSLGDEARMKYRFIILTDFPVNVTPELGVLLSKIAESGPRAGVYILMSWDVRGDFSCATQSNDAFNPDNMLSSMMLIVPKGGRYFFKNSSNDEMFNRFNLILDASPINHLDAKVYLEKIDEQVDKAKKSVKSKNIKPDYVKLRDSEYIPAMKGINVVVGKDIHDKRDVSFSFMSKDFIHGFVLGQSGSGKSVLLNSIITSAVLKYSPQDLMLYLMDFKGVEFNSYRGLKHTKAVLVDSSDPQMTLEVLRELYEEDKRRRKLWVNEDVKSIDGYNTKHPNKRLPQVVFVADECQVMFKQPSNDTERVVLKEISDILVHIAKIGRSQGIHMLLATQQLGEVNIHNDILENLTECFILRSAPRDSDRLVPESSGMTEKQETGIACYYHQKKLQGQVQTFYANDDEQRQALYSAQIKASGLSGNGEYYFSGSAQYTLADESELRLVKAEIQKIKSPTAFIGRKLGLKGQLASVTLERDFSENILFIGSNKEEQTVGVAISSLETIIMSNEYLCRYCNVKVIDCYNAEGTKYRAKLEEMQSNGQCEIIDRRESGKLLKHLVDDIHKQMALPTILVIIGSERFFEMKRNSPLGENGQKKISSSVVDMEFICNDDGSKVGLEEEIQKESDRLSSINSLLVEEDSYIETYPEALRYILDEGPMQDVHVLLQVDKPANILFEDYPDQTVSMFKHKVILKSENKNLAAMRFSVDIDVESLSDECERLRAYYYPENGTPQLFTPYIMNKD